MQVGLLGPLDVRTDAGEPCPIAGVRLARLLSVLALQPGRVVSTSAIVDAVWGDAPPAEPGNAVQALVSRLRRAAGGLVIASRAQGYALDIEPDSIDVIRFERLVRGAEPEQMHRALDLWRGPALADAGDADFAVAARARLDELRLVALQRRIAGDLATKSAGPLVSELEGLVATYPLREPLILLLMRAHLAAGDRVRALATFDDARRRLADELGITPSAELAAEHLAILRADGGDDGSADAAERNRSGAGGHGAGAGNHGVDGHGAGNHAVDGHGAGSHGVDGHGAGNHGVDGREADGHEANGREANGREAKSDGRSQKDETGAPTNLRAEISSFIGRDADVADIDALLSRHRLVTLIGPGGAGKTRLAAHSAREQIASSPGGVWMIEFAPVTDPGDVVSTVLADLGVRDTALVRKPNGALAALEGVDLRERLIASLAHRDALLVFDNCEHLIDATASLAADILGACPGIRILSTSREALGVVGEVLRPVEPLALPDDRWTSVEQLMTYPSIRLFAQRASAVRPGFTVTTANADAVVSICRALDGMPLAIELAAARMRGMSPEQIADRLGDRFATLNAGNRTALPRHQTLRAVVDWSWDLLDDAERVVWRRLAMFSGGATLDAAEAVCADRDFDTLTTLCALVDKSLLTMREEESGTRYVMLETIRAYGLMRLDEAGERSATRIAHAAYFRDLCEAARWGLLGPEQFTWLAALRADHDNLNTAIRNSITDGQAMTAVRLVGSVAWYWWISGHRREGSELATETFALLADDDWETSPDLDLDDQQVRSDLEVRAAAYSMSALLVIDGDQQKMIALEWFDRGVAIVDRLGAVEEPILRMVRPLRTIFHTFETATAPPTIDIGMPVDDPFPWVRAMARVMRAHVMLNLGRMHAEAEADFRSALTIFRSLGEAWGTSFTLLSLATLESWRGELHEAIAGINEAIRFSSRLGMWEDRVGFRTQLVRLLWLTGDEAGARIELATAARDAVRVGIAEAQATVAYAAADLARFTGDLVTADIEVRRAADLIADHIVAPQFQAMLVSAHGYIASAAGDLPEARRLHMEAVRQAVASIDAPIIAQTLVGLADLALSEGDARLAATVLGASTAVRGTPDLSLVDGIRVTEAAQRELGASGFRAAYQRGLTGSITQIAELVDVPMDGLAELPAMVGDAIAPATESGGRGGA